MPRRPLALLVLLAGTSALFRSEDEDLRTRGALAADVPLPVYGPDRADLRNRLFHAFFTATVDATIDGSPAPPLPRVEGGARATIAFGAARGTILDDPRYADVLSLLERALEDRALRAQSPLHRVLLQHDLWTAHDALFARRAALAGDDERRLARCDRLVALLARAIVRFAPREDEIAALPAPPLPADVGPTTGEAAPTHAKADGFRVAFSRHALAPGDRGRALVGRLVAIDSSGAPRTTPIPARVEILVSGAASFTLDRTALLASPLGPAALAPLAPGDPAPASPFSIGSVAYAPRADRCAACHAAPSPLPAAAPAPGPGKAASPEFASIRAAFEEARDR